MIAGLAIAVLILAVAFALGPRPTVDTRLAPVDVPAGPEALEAWLAAAEARFPDITPGAEKAIAWADPERPARTDVAIVYVHGFSATRQEVAPLCERLGARLGANVFYARLRGHGRPGAALGDVTVNDWLQDGAEALAIGRRLGRKVVVIGVSTGATLATWLLAAHDASDVAAAALVSPNFATRGRRTRFLTWPWGEPAARLLAGAEHAWEPANDRMARYWTTRYPMRALATMQALLDLVDRTDLGAFRTPLLVVYSRRDQVIDPARVEERFQDFAADPKRLARFEEADDPKSHVIAGDIVSPQATPKVEALIADFLAPLLGASPPGAGDGA